jgi:hypothetical protein
MPSFRKCISDNKSAAKRDYYRKSNFSLSRSSSNTASVANAGVGATYSWSITNGSIDAGAGTNSISYTAGASGSVTLNVTVTNSNNCQASGNTTITINPLPNGSVSIQGSNPICSGGATSIMFGFGSANSGGKLIYQINGVSQPQVTLNGGGNF